MAETGSSRTDRLAGILARAVAQAVHEAVSTDEAMRTSRGKEHLAKGLLLFAAHLVEGNFSKVKGLIDVARLLLDKESQIL